MDSSNAEPVWETIEAMGTSLLTVRTAKIAKKREQTSVPHTHYTLTIPNEIAKTYPNYAT